MIEFEPFYSCRSTVYNLPGFEPGKVDKAYLQNLGVNVEPSEETLCALAAGSEVFRRRYVNDHPVLLEGWDRLL